MILWFKWMWASLAQSVERKALNLVVAGSSPAGGAFLFECLRFCRFLRFWGKWKPKNISSTWSQFCFVGKLRVELGENMCFPNQHRTPTDRCRFCVQPGVNCFHSRKVPDPFAGDSTFQPHNLSPFWACPVCSAAASWRLTSTEWWNPAQNGMAGKSLAIHNSDGKNSWPGYWIFGSFLSHNASTEWKPKPSTEWNTAIRLQPFHSVLVFRFHSVLALWLRKWSENSIPGSGVFFPLLTNPYSKPISLQPFHSVLVFGAHSVSTSLGLYWSIAARPSPFCVPACHIQCSVAASSAQPHHTSHHQKIERQLGGSNPRPLVLQDQCSATELNRRWLRCFCCFSCEEVFQDNTERKVCKKRNDPRRNRNRRWWIWNP